MPSFVFWTRGRELNPHQQILCCPSTADGPS
jgi:hypothetical protein